MHYGAMTNRTSPAPVRLTPAAYLAGLTFLIFLATVAAYVANQPLVYVVTLPLTLVGILVTGDVAGRYARR